MCSKSRQKTLRVQLNPAVWFSNPSTKTPYSRWNDRWGRKKKAFCRLKQDMMGVEELNNGGSHLNRLDRAAVTCHVIKVAGTFATELRSSSASTKCTWGPQQRWVWTPGNVEIQPSSCLLPHGRPRTIYRMINVGWQVHVHVTMFLHLASGLCHRVCTVHGSKLWTILGEPQPESGGIRSSPGVTGRFIPRTDFFSSKNSWNTFDLHKLLIHTKPRIRSLKSLNSSFMTIIALRMNRQLG